MAEKKRLIVVRQFADKISVLWAEGDSVEILSSDRITTEKK